MWTEDDIGDLTCRTALVTGANSGIGFHTARLLRAHGADVVLACRDAGRAAAAATTLEDGGPGGAVRTLTLDLASLESVRTAAAAVDRPLDLLVCNAGVMLAKGRTEDGFEVHMGTNHLGHFALTGLLLGLLLDRLLAAPGSRVVVVGSLGARLARLDVDRLDRGRSGFLAYGRSKLATMLFAQALHHRLTAAGAGILAVSAHPGGARTGIVRHSERLQRRAAQPELGWRRALFAEPEVAVRSIVRAATDPTAAGGEFYGPDGPFGLTGAPALARPGRAVLDRGRQQALWASSEQLTGVRYRFPVPVRRGAGVP